VKIQPPAGSFYLFPDFKPFKTLLNNRNIHDSETLCEKLLQDTGVALLPGSVFGRSKNEFTARLAYVNFDGALALQNSRSLSKERKLTIDHLGDIVSEVKQGINHIITWLER
jgi:aspartate aminotransferase